MIDFEIEEEIRAVDRRVLGARHVQLIRTHDARRGSEQRRCRVRGDIRLKLVKTLLSYYLESGNAVRETAFEQLVQRFLILLTESGDE